MLAQLIPALRIVFLTPPPAATPLPSQQQQQQQQQGKGGSKPGFAGFEPQRHMLLLEFDKLANVSGKRTRACAVFVCVCACVCNCMLVTACASECVLYLYAYLSCDLHACAPVYKIVCMYAAGQTAPSLRAVAPCGPRLSPFEPTSSPPPGHFHLTPSLL